VGARLVHDNSHPDIVDLHLHPKDVPGAIVALDITDPAGSWRWGGPAWTAAIPTHEPGGLLGLTVAVHEPETVAGIWSRLLGVLEHAVDEELDPARRAGRRRDDVDRALDRLARFHRPLPIACS